jgi:hypothetical protein
VELLVLDGFFDDLFRYIPGTRLKRIYNPITAMGFSAMFTFQLDWTFNFNTFQRYFKSVSFRIEVASILFELNNQIENLTEMITIPFEINPHLSKEGYGDTWCLKVPFGRIDTA